MKGIFNLDGLKNNSISKKSGTNGIYLWGVKNGSRYIPLYVGKGRNIHERIFQHLSRWRGGEYRIPKWSEITATTISIPFTKDNKLLYIPHGANLYSDFLKNKTIQATIKKVIDNFFCCWLELSESINLYEEEDALATIFGKGKLISSHRKKDTLPTKFTKQLYDDFNNATKKTSP